MVLDDEFEEREDGDERDEGEDRDDGDEDDGDEPHRIVMARASQWRGTFSFVAVSVSPAKMKAWKIPGKYDFDTIESGCRRSTSQFK